MSLSSLTLLYVVRGRDISHTEKSRPSETFLGPHVKPNTTSDTGTLLLLENKRQNVPPCLMGPEGGGECKFQYELITLSQPASKARGLQNFPEDKPRKCVDLVSHTGRSGGRGWGPQAALKRARPVTLVVPRMLTMDANSTFVTAGCRGGGRGQ